MKTDKKQMNEQEINLEFFPRSLFLLTQFAMMAKRAEEYHKKNKMKMKTAGTTLALIFTMILGFNAQAQDENTQQTKTRPFQITFVTPMGTNGTNALNITNEFSINLLAGYNGGLDGIALSGFGSMLKNDMKGTQLSGFGNIVMGTGKGFQGAGQFNYTQKHFNGVQVSGFANIIANDAKAWQISGFTNVTTGTIDGAQLAGFANYAEGTTIGQAGSFINVNKGDLKGIQIAGFANVNTEKTEGIQISGFANYTKTLSGVQLAPFNYVDSLEKGLPIGIFSLVKNGYKTIEISANETLYGVVSFKTGVKKFYNIISVGSSIHHNKTYWGWGYGIGTMMPVKNDWNVAIELLSYHINEDEWFTEALNLNNKLQITASKKVSEKTELFGGISWNVNVSELEDHDGNAFESTFTPYYTFNETYDNEINVKMYPGLTAGIRF